MSSEEPEDDIIEDGEAELDDELDEDELDDDLEEGDLGLPDDDDDDAISDEADDDEDEDGPVAAPAAADEEDDDDEIEADLDAILKDRLDSGDDEEDEEDEDSPAAKKKPAPKDPGELQAKTEDEQTCESCWLIKPLVQFPAGGAFCIDCA